MKPFQFTAYVIVAALCALWALPAFPLYWLVINMEKKGWNKL